MRNCLLSKAEMKTKFLWRGLDCNIVIWSCYVLSALQIELNVGLKHLKFIFVSIKDWWIDTMHCHIVVKCSILYQITKENTISKNYETIEPCQWEEVLNSEKKKQPRLQGIFFNSKSIKKKRILGTAYLSIEIGPSSLGQSIEHIFHKHRHRICNM